MNTKKNQIFEQFKEWEESESLWLEIFYEIQQAQMKLLNFQLLVTVKRNQPKYCTITFNHSTLADFDVLKKYVGEYGFVVPVK